MRKHLIVASLLLATTLPLATHAIAGNEANNPADTGQKPETTVLLKDRGVFINAPGGDAKPTGKPGRLGGGRDKPADDLPADQGVDGPYSSSSDQDEVAEPPHLVCRFMYTDEGVVIVFQNSGGPLPPWTKISATWEGGSSSLSWPFADGLPGQSKFETAPLPKWSKDKIGDAPCVVTVENWNPF